MAAVQVEGWRGGDSKSMLDNTAAWVEARRGGESKRMLAVVGIEEQGDTGCK
jgi:hypothetical protein